MVLYGNVAERFTLHKSNNAWAKIGQSALNKLNLPGNQEQRNESVIYKAKFRCLNNELN